MEDRQIKPFQKIENFHEIESKKITIGNQVRLGVRNAFNITSKFLLLLLVFSFVVVSTASAYTGFKNQNEERSKYGYNQFFQNISDDRIIIKKDDNSVMTPKDYEKLEALNNIKYVEKNDILSDNQLSIQRGNVFFNGYPKSVSSFSGTVDMGNIPKGENEILVVGNTKYIASGSDLESMLGKRYKLSTNDEEKTITVKLVGLKEEKDASAFSSLTIYLSPDLMEELKAQTYEFYSQVKVTVNDQTYDGKYQYPVVPSTKVKKGEAIVPEEFNYLYSNGYSLNHTIKISTQNIYFGGSVSPTITATYNKNNFQTRIGYKSYDTHNGEIYINKNDFESLFDKGNYQCSVYVKDTKKIDETTKALEDAGFKPMALRNYLQDFGGQEIVNIIQIPLLIIFIVGVFFIAYFVTRLILKSRGVYFTTLRMVGLAKAYTKRILDIELFTVVTIAYGLVLGVVALVKNQIINLAYIKSLVEYLTVGDYIILYAVLLFMAFLLSRRFARRLFKKSAMVTFREEA